MTRVRAVGAGALLLVALWPCTQAAARTWRLARGPSSVEFAVGHLLFSKVSGRFSRFSGSVHCPGESFETATIEAVIDVRSVYTGHRDRDRHLRSEDFFFEDRFPEIRFASRSVRRTGPDAYEITGDLTIRGITREVVLQAEARGERDTTLGRRTDFRATGTVNRSDFGLTWNDLWSGEVLLGEQVEIALDVALIEEPDAQALP